MEVINTFVEDLKVINIDAYFINVNGKIINTFKHSELHFMIDDGKIIDGKKEIIGKLFPLFDSGFCKTCPAKIFNECKKI